MSATGQMLRVLQPDLYNFLAVSSLIYYALFTIIGWILNDLTAHNGHFL